MIFMDTTYPPRLGDYRGWRLEMFTTENTQGFSAQDLALMNQALAKLTAAGIEEQNASDIINNNWQESGNTVETLCGKMKNTITAARAAEILADEDAEHLPYRVLNQAGRAAVATWVKVTAKRPDQNLDAWYSDAENAANDARPGESIIIEMRGLMTISGNPETLTIPDSAFDWQV